MDSRINIAILGAVSAGKSTFLNSLFVKTYSDMKIKRTTMVPQVYHEVKNLRNHTSSKEIRERNAQINNILIKKTENGEEISQDDIKEAEYFVPQIYDLAQLKKNVFLSIYDIPGLNDSKTKNLYFNYIDTNFYKFDVIFFVIDINSAINTSDEVDILVSIIKNIKKNKESYNIDTKLIILMNKCDEMYLDNGKLLLGEEYAEMFNQAKKIIDDNIKNIYPGLIFSMIRLSSEDAYVYRMYKVNPKAKLDMKYINKFGYNEYGKTRWNKLSEKRKTEKIAKIIKETNYKDAIKLTGFTNLKSALEQYLTPENQYNYISNHVKYELFNITNFNNVDISIEINKFYNINNKIKILSKEFKKTDMINLCEDIFDKYIDNYLGKHLIDKVTTSNVNEFKIIRKCFEKIRSLNLFWKDKYDTTYNKIINSDNDYSLGLLTNVNIDPHEAIEIIKKLKNDCFPEWSTQIGTFIDNNKKLLEMHANDLVKILDFVKKSFDLNSHTHLSLACKLLVSMYLNIGLSNTCYNISDQEHVSSYVFTAYDFWNNYKNSNIGHRKVVMNMKYMASSLHIKLERLKWCNSKPMHVLKYVDLPLEKYIINLMDNINSNSGKDKKISPIKKKLIANKKNRTIKRNKKILPIHDDSDSDDISEDLDNEINK